MQTAGHRIRLAVELAPGVQGGQHHLDRGTVLHRVVVHRDAAAVVGDPDPAVGEQGHIDTVGVAGQRLVNRVVYNLLNEVMQAALSRRADVHAGALADGLQPLQNRDRARIV